jgi:hypothetical protein
LSAHIFQRLTYRDEYTRPKFTNASVVVVEPNGEKIHYDDAPKYQYDPSNDAKNSDHINVYRIGAADNTVFIIGATTRGNVVFPLVEIHANGLPRFNTHAELSDIDKYKCMMAIMPLIGSVYGAEYEYRKIFGVYWKHTENFILEKMDFENLKKEFISPDCDQQERLARALGSKAVGLTYSGTVHDVNMNTTTGSVSGTVMLERVGEIYQARIKAKPDALAGMNPQQIATFAYDPTEPLGESLPKQRDAEEFAELIEGFNK